MPKTTFTETSINSADEDEMDHNEPSLGDLVFLPFCSNIIFSPFSKIFNQNSQCQVFKSKRFMEAYKVQHGKVLNSLIVITGHPLGM